MQKKPRKYGSETLTPFLSALTRSHKFQHSLFSLREKYGISEDEDRTPNEWGEVHFDAYHDLRKDIKKLCGEYELPYEEFHQAMLRMLFFSSDGVVLPLTTSQPMFRVIDLKEEKVPSDPAFPIAVLVHPHAGIREFERFLANHYKRDIKPLQDKYKKPGSKIGKFKDRDPLVQQRNDFIYKHRALPRKDISLLITKRYGSEGIYDLDTGAIGKIISLETKARKDL